MLRLLDRREAAAALHVSLMTVRRLGAAGDLDEIRVGQRAVRITADSVEAHIAARRITRARPQPAAPGDELAARQAAGRDDRVV